MFLNGIIKDQLFSCRKMQECCYLQLVFTFASHLLLTAWEQDLQLIIYVEKSVFCVFISLGATRAAKLVPPPHLPHGVCGDLQDGV